MFWEQIKFWWPLASNILVCALALFGIACTIEAVIQCRIRGNLAEAYRYHTRAFMLLLGAFLLLGADKLWY